MRLKFQENRDGHFSKILMSVMTLFLVLSFLLVMIQPVSAAGEKLIVFTDKKIYRDEAYSFDDQSVVDNYAIDNLAVTVYVMVIDADGNVITTNLNFGGKLDDVQLQDHQASSDVHHNITYNPSHYDNVALSNFSDNGTSPDITAGDGIYTSYTNVSELPSTISQEHLVINITVNESTYGLEETYQVLFTRGGCYHNNKEVSKSNAHGKHIKDGSEQTPCVLCHWGYEHYLGKHETNMTPVDVKNLGGGQTWNYMTGDTTGTITTEDPWSKLGDSHYCYTCHYSGTTGNGAWDFTTDNTTDRPSCSSASSVAGASCHAYTNIEDKSLTDNVQIDWQAKSKGASADKSHNYTSTNPANISCGACHQNWHSCYLPNESYTEYTNIDQQCWDCHDVSDGWINTSSGDHPHNKSRYACKTCHVGYDASESIWKLGAHNVSAGYEGGGPNCVSCHNKGQRSARVDVQAMDTENSTHKYLNNETGTSLDANNQRCWACHGEDDNADGVANESEQPTAPGHPTNYSNPRTCTDCHSNTDVTNFGAPQNVAHTWYDSGRGAINTPGVTACPDCHAENEMWNRSNDDPDGSTISSINTEAAISSHYELVRHDLKDLIGEDEYCNYCHQNTSTTFYDVFVDKGDISRPLHARKNNPDCTNSSCHGPYELHQEGLVDPEWFSNENCTECHTQTFHNYTVNCTACHMETASDIHPNKYLQEDGNVYSTSKLTATSCQDCHQHSKADETLNTTAPAIPATWAHSDDPENGTKWNSTPGYWNNTPSANAFVSDYSINNGNITNFSNAQSYCSNYSAITEVRLNSFEGTFPSNQEFTSDSTNWTSTVTGDVLQAYDSTDGAPAGCIKTYVDTKPNNVGTGNWTTNFTYTHDPLAPVESATISVDTNYTLEDPTDPGAEVDYQIDIVKPSGQSVTIYSETISNATETVPINTWRVLNNYSISNPNNVFDEDGSYDLVIHTSIDTTNSDDQTELKFDNVVLYIKEDTPYRYNVTFNFSGINDYQNKSLELSAMEHGEDCSLYVYNGTAWNQRATINRTAFTVISYELKPDEFLGDGNVSVRLVDADKTFDSTQNDLEIQYSYVHSDTGKTSSCIYCHHSLGILENALGTPADFQGNNVVNQSISTGNWCAGCHYQNYSSGNKTYVDMITSFQNYSRPIPPEITGNETYGANTSHPDYYNHSSETDFSDSRCLDCHGGDLSTNVGMTSFGHKVTEGNMYVIDTSVSGVPLASWGGNSNLDPGSSDIDADNIVNVTVHNSTNVNWNLSIKGSGNFTSNGDQLDLGNLEFGNISGTDLDKNVTTNYKGPELFSNWCNQSHGATEYRNIYFELTIPSEQPAGDYSTQVYIRVSDAT